MNKIGREFNGSWLDRVTYDDVRECLTKLGYDAEEEESSTIQEIEWVKNQNDQEMFCAHVISGNSAMQLFFSEFGEVYFDSGEYILTDTYLRSKSLRLWHDIVRRANDGVLINGQTYDEAFTEFYEARNYEYFMPDIERLKRELTRLENAKIRANWNLHRMVESNANASDELGE